MSSERKRWSALKEKVKGRRRMSAFGKVFCVGCVILVVVLIGGLLYQSRGYQSFEVLSSMTKTDNASVHYLVTDNGLLRYSKDGISYSRDLDETLWNHSFEMESPDVVVSGESIVVADIGSNQILIYEEDEQTGEITTEHPVADVTISSEGIVASIQSEDTSNYIFLYSQEGEELVTIKTSISQMGYPVGLALSETGENLAVSYLNVADGIVYTNLVFYNFGDIGTEEEDHITGTFTYESLVTKIEFITDMKLAVFEEEGFDLYTVNDYPELSHQIDFGQEIESLFISDQYIGFVLKNNTQTVSEDGESESGEEEGKYLMKVYTYSARLSMEQDFDFDYDTVISTSKEIVFYNDTSCAIYTLNGKEKFSYTFDESIESLLPKEVQGEYYLITGSTVEEIRLSKGE